MIRSIQQAIRRNTIVYLALFLTLGMGTAYASGTITSADIVDGEVKRPDIAANAVASGQIADLGVSSADIQPNAVTAGHIRANAVNAAKIATDAIAADELAPGAVSSGELADNAVGAPDIATGAVESDEIGTGAVGSTEIAADAVDSTEIAPAAVGATEIAPDAVGTSEIAKLPAAIAYRGDSVTIPSDMPTVIAFQRLVTDANPTTADGAGVFGLAQPTRLTAPVAGLYQVQALVYWQPDSTPSGFREIGIRCTGCVVDGQPAPAEQLVAHDRTPAHGPGGLGLVGNENNSQVSSVSALVAMKPGDYVETLVFQNSAEQQTIAGRDPRILSPAFSLTWIAPTP
ncbi:MAG TPA: hypothetical protein VMY78_12715 [Solirubrobacteraceae bacterium]|nr:hypothetical protein [Solirubrobacteraceae bacterium]